MSAEPDYIIFDLDGTLADSQEGILLSFRLTLDEFELFPSDDKLRSLIGPPLQESFTRLGFEPDELEGVIARYREIYESVGVNKAYLYDGIEETLRLLANRGTKMAVATAKLGDFAKMMLTSLGISRYFQIIVGVSIDESLRNKRQVMNEVLQYLQPRDKHRVWMVGDREQDILASLFHGVIPVGALWGYGSKDELETSGARYIVEHPLDLLELKVTDDPNE